MSGLASFAAGFGGGYLNAKRQEKIDAERAEDRAMRKQDFDNQQATMKEARDLKLSLADATRPAVVSQGAGGMLKPETMDNRDVGLADMASMPNGGLNQGSFSVGGKSYADKPAADAAAAQYDQPGARTLRLADAYGKAGMVDKAMSLESNQAKAQREQAEYGQKLKKEGVLDAMQHFRSGDAAGLEKVFNANGEFKLDGAPVLTKVDRDVPGAGKMTTYDAKVRLIGPDGKVIEKTLNSHDLSMQFMPFEKQMEALRKGNDSDNKFTYQSGLLDAKQSAANATLAAAQIRASGRGAGSDGTSREERLRYTSLFNDAGRRAGEAQKALSTLQRDPMYSVAKEGTPRFQELQELRDTIKQHNQERGMYQSMLAGSQNGAAAKPPALSDAVRPAAAAKSTAPAKQDFSNLWK